MNDFTKQEMLGALGMSKLTFYKYFKDLEELGLVTPTRRIGRATLYKINLQNPFVKMLVDHERQLPSQIAAQEAANLQRLAPVRSR